MNIKYLTLADMVEWWQKDGGHFNVELYLRVCRAKNALINGIWK